MSAKLLGQILLKSRAGIEKGVLRIQDIVERYRNAGGGELSTEDQAFLLKQFNEMAPEAGSPFSNVEEVFFGPGDTRLGGKKRGPNVQKAGEMSDTPVTDDIEETLGVKLRGDESFGELMEKLEGSPNKTLQKAFDKANKEEGIGSLFPKGKGAIFEKIDDRDDVADFVKKMRKEGIANKDIKGVFKEFGTDIEGGKRAATTLARAADMGADTKIKQELLSELDEMKFDRGPRFFQEEYMGYDDFISAVEAKKIEVNNAIVDDLEAMGVPDEKISDIMGIARRQRDSNFYTSGEEFVDVIKEELDFNDIKYDVEFYKNYFKELESLLRKPEPRFEYGGMV